MKFVKGKRLIDGTSGAVIESPLILIEGDKVCEVGSWDSAAVPPGVEVIDASDYTLMPGLIDCHIHLAAFNARTFDDFRVGQWELTPELQQMYALFHAQLCLEMGFTTLRDVGWSSARDNLRVGCDLLKTCASGGGGTDKEEPTVQNMTQEELDAIVDEAHAFLKPAAVHCFTPDSQRKALAAGADTLEHMVFTDDDAISKINAAGVWVTPTLAHRTDHAIEVRRRTGGTDYSLKKMQKLQPHCFETFQRMHAAGVNIAMGTDTSYDPEMGHGSVELEIYVNLGMSPMEAILTVTQNAATAIGLSDTIGTIEVGKHADLIAVDGDPLQDISVLQQRSRIAMVMKDGKVCVDRRPGNSKEVVQVDPDSWKIFGT
jgi:imidazolonepropionase-like amidohydrolase